MSKKLKNTAKAEQMLSEKGEYVELNFEECQAENDNDNYYERCETKAWIANFMQKSIYC